MTNKTKLDFIIKKYGKRGRKKKILVSLSTPLCIPSFSVCLSPRNRGHTISATSRQIPGGFTTTLK